MSSHDPLGITPGEPPPGSTREIPVTLDLTEPAPGPTAARFGRPIVDGFEVIDELGRGGMGVVYKARQAGLNRVVALKMIRVGGIASDDQLARFRFEAEAVARLQHPHIVQIFHVGESHGLPYLVLEYLEGGNLAERIGGRPQPLREAAELVETLARAIDHAHRRGIVHRDLKPSNILLAANGTPKIGDFGLAKGLDEDGATASGVAVLGTAGYVSPEQAWGADRGDEIGPGTDIYALGVILYELLTGRTPFQGKSHLEVLQQVWSAEPEPPSSVRPGVASDLETICLTCLRKEASRRYADADALADDLRRYLNGEPIAARPVGRAERVWRWSLRNPLPAGLLVALMFMFLAGFGLVADEWYEALKATRRAIAGEGLASRRAIQALKAEQAAIVRKQEADAEREKAERALASFLVVAAERAYTNGDVDRAVELLGRCRADLRNWEWRYLRRLCVGSRLTIAAHPGRATAVAFSPDGTRLATAGDAGPERAGEVSLRDAETGRQRHALIGHTRTARSVAFSPDGRQLASAGDDETVRLWNAETGALIRTIEGFARCLSYRPDGREIAVGGDRSIRIVDPADGRTIRTLRGLSGIVSGISYSADGTRLAAASAYIDDKGLTEDREPVAGEIKVWDTANGQEQITIRNDRTRAVGALALSPDGKLVAAAAGHPEIHAVGPGEVIVWDANTGQEVRTLRGHTRRVFSVAFRRDGQQIATGGDDRIIRVWDVATGGELRQLRGHASAIVALTFDSSGARIASAEERGGIVKVWDASESLGSWVDPTGRDVVTFTKSARLVSAGADNTIRIRSGGSPATVLRGHEEPVIAIAARPGGSQIASSSYDHTVRIWDADSGQPILVVREEPEVNALAYSPNGTRLATASGGEIVIRDATNGGQLLRFRAHPGSITGLAYAPDGTRLATSGGEGSIKVWDAVKGVLITSRDDLRTPFGLAFRPDGTALAVATGSEGSVRVWDYGGGRPDVILLRHDGWVRSVAFNPDGSRLASAADDGTIKLWDVALGQDLITLRDPDGTAFRSVAFSPDGLRLSAAGPARIVVWDGSPQ